MSARKNLRVALSAEDTAGKFLELQQKQLELGALSPLDIYQAEQTMASRKLDVAQARFRLAQLEKTLCVSRSGADLDLEASSQAPAGADGDCRSSEHLWIRSIARTWYKRRSRAVRT